MKKTVWTLATAFEHVVTVMEGSNLSTESFNKIADATAYLHDVLGVSERQSYILAVMFKRLGSTTSTSDLSDFASTSVLSILDMQNELDELVQREFVVCLDDSSYRKWEQTFMLGDGVVQAVRYNRPFEPLDMSDLSAEDVLETIQTLLNECDYSKISYKAMERQLLSIIGRTQHVKLCNRLEAYDLHPYEKVLLLIACVAFVVKKEDFIDSGDYDDILPNYKQRVVHRQFETNSGKLVESGLMEKESDCYHCYRLTDKGRAELLNEFSIEGVQDEETEKAEAPVQQTQEQESPTIAEKKLYYNSREKVQVERLAGILTDENFAKVQERMRAAGMRPGFTAILYGEPGTGKTETVLQLARLTGRSIIQVDLAALRDKFVGESEKNIQKVFDDYHEALTQSTVVPILLFNEADGIFGKRNQSIQSSVDQMENTIQNIILQNMETFEGIMIATTNLTVNLDSAFDRRFLYKIEFRKPSREVREQIWLTLVPGLQPEDAKTLASRYELSGGQIENISRKQMIENILYDTPISLSKLCSFCDEEGFRRTQRSLYEHRKIS